MADFKLYLGNKNYSSWSMRGWLAMKQSGAEFDEEVFHLGAPGVRDEIGRVSPTTKVPSLHHGERVIWDSLAIAEYLAELFPKAGIWPEEPAARARARSVSAEMHSSFPALRRSMPFNVRRHSPGKGRDEGVQEDIDRILAIWRSCRDDFAGDGDFLTGPCSMADFMYAPVVSRFRTYEVPIEDAELAAWADRVWEHPFVLEWRAAAETEEAVEPEYDL